MVVAGRDIRQQVNDALVGTRTAANQVRLAVASLAAERLTVLTLRDFTAASQMMSHSRSELYKRLDISVLDHLILEKILGLSGDREKANLTFCHDAAEAVNRVAEGEYQLAFLVKPVKAEAVKAIADAGDRMPRKSTYFYPKLPAGLVVNRLV